MPSNTSDGNIIIGQVWGIPIKFNPSLLLILGIVTWTLAGGLLPNAYPEMSTIGRWLTGLFTAILFFASILFHELAHAWEARRQGIPVLSITLYIFGGLAQIGGSPKTPGNEFRVAAIGPASSLLLGGLFLALNRLVGDQGYLGASTQWLGYINILLAGFNLLPGYPLDGGRILESIVWGITGKRATGVKVASTAGQIIAYVMIGYGIFQSVRGDLLGGLWSILIGFFLNNAATSERRALLQQDLLSGTLVSGVMGIVKEPEVPTSTTLQDLVENHILGRGQSSFIVTAAGNPAGVLSLRDVSQEPREEWARTTAGDLMTPLNSLPRVAPGDELLDAVQLMEANGLLYLPVFDGARLVGLLTRDEVIRHLGQQGAQAA